MQVDHKDALEKLLPVTSIPWYDIETLNEILSFCEDMLYRVPAYEISFTPGSEVVNVLEEFLSV